MIKKGRRMILDLLQFTGIFLVYGFFQCFTFQAGSRLAGFIGRQIGKRIPQRHRALRNLHRAWPELSLARRQQIVEGMFDNFARSTIECITLNRLKIYAPDSRVEVRGQDIIDQLKEDQQPAILFTGHMANWELGTRAGTQKGLCISQSYRKFNYPLTDRLIRWINCNTGPNELTKGLAGTRQMVMALGRGEHIAMLTDQRMNEGEWIPFFGIPAKTATGSARMALKFNCPFVPVRVERLPHARFRVTYYPPLRSSKPTLETQVTDLLTQMNQLMEEWIRARPEQWLWLHNRWPKGYKNLKVRQISTHNIS